jgi:hypothetical protein
MLSIYVCAKQHMTLSKYYLSIHLEGRRGNVWERSISNCHQCPGRDLIKVDPGKYQMLRAGNFPTLLQIAQVGNVSLINSTCWLYEPKSGLCRQIYNS